MTLVPMRNTPALLLGGGSVAVAPCPGSQAGCRSAAGSLGMWCKTRGSAVVARGTCDSHL